MNYKTLNLSVHTENSSAATTSLRVTVTLMTFAHKLQQKTKTETSQALASSNLPALGQTDDKGTKRN
jgi:hypothetical protein